MSTVQALRITTIPSEWVSWVKENLTLGVDPTLIVATLIKHGFEEQSSIELLESCRRPAEEGSVSPNRVNTLGPQLTSEPGIPEGACKLVMAMERPRIRVYRDLLTVEECRELIERARPRLERSTTVDDHTGKVVEHHARTSAGTFFAINDDEFIASIDSRISKLMGLPVENGEGLQILHYGVGGEYQPHYDYFPVDKPGGAVHTATCGQRVATLVLYLNSAEEGGETVFPEINLKVSPLTGGAVYFAYHDVDGNLDPLSLHGGMPVVKGEKWIATKWMRERRFG